MKLSKIAFKNLKRNFSFYSLYLFSVSFVLMIFFCFVSFSKNEVIMASISSDGRVETMCRIVSILIMAFVVFYMSYSNKFFMQRRMKELGVYALLGYQKSQMFKLLTIENIIVCIGGLVIGILTGGLLHKSLTIGITLLLGLNIDLSSIPFINLDAVLVSLVFVIIVLAALALSNAKLLYKSILLDLVRLENKNDKPIKIRKSFALSGVIVLFGGYTLAFDMVRGKESLWYTIGFSPMALLTFVSVVAGTAFFIYSFLPFLCFQMKKKKNNFYRETTIITVSKFMHRIQSNAKSLILLILISAGTLSILGSTILSLWYPLEALERIIPAAIEFRAENYIKKEQAVEVLNENIGKENYKYYETNILKTTAVGDNLPFEYNISEDKGRTPGFECISMSDYVSLIKLHGKENSISNIDDSECVLIKYKSNPDNVDLNQTYTLNIGNHQKRALTVKETTLENPIGFANSVGTLVVSDNLYNLMKSNGIDVTKVISVDSEDMPSIKKAYIALSELMPNNPYLVSAYQRQAELVYANSSTLLLICFTTSIFLIAIGSILYFQNISSIIYDKADYEILKKMGYNELKIKKVIRRQVQVYFIIPYLLGTIHSIFALICYKSALMDDLLGKSSAVLMPIIFSIVLYTTVYMVYYLITKHSCYKIVL